MVEIPDLREDLSRVSQFIRVVMHCLGGSRDYADTSHKVLSLLCDLLDLLYRIKDQLNWAEEKWFFHPIRLEALHEILLLLESSLRFNEVYLHPGGVAVREFRRHLLEHTVIPRLEQYKVALIFSTQPDSDQWSSVDRDIRTQLRHCHDLEPGLKHDRRHEHDIHRSTDRLSSENFLTLADLCHRRQQGTCQWIFDNPTYRKWLRGTARTLYCVGSAGVGKTFVSSAVIDALQRTFTSPDVAIVFLFCHEERGKGQSSTALLQNILAQLVYRRRGLSYSTNALYSFESMPAAKASGKAYQNAIRAEVNRFSKVFFVVDGLDSVAEKERLLNRLQKLPGHAQLLVTVQERKQLDKLNHITVSAPAEDIRLYTVARIRQDAALTQFIENDSSAFGLQDNILQHVVEKSHGIFLLAQLQMDLLARCEKPNLIYSILSHLPENLEEAYAEVMKRVMCTNPRARRYIYWTFYARRPLTVPELKYATNEGEEADEGGKDQVSFESRILSDTSGLLTIDAVTGTVSLVHRTAKHALQRMASASTIFSAAQKEIAEMCLTLISADEVVDDCYANRGSTPRSSSGSLLDYAAAYWGYHAREAAEEEQTIQVLIMTFLNKLSWRRLSNNDGSAHGSEFPEELGIGKYPDDWTTLHYLAYFGIRCRTKRLIEEYVDINAHDNSLGMTALHCAAYRGDEAMVELLLDNHADINAQAANGDTALHLATLRGDGTVMKLLLARGIDTKIMNKQGSPALQVAIGTTGDEITVPLLINRKADVNATNTKTGNTALHLAVKCKRPRILLFLIDKGADLNLFNQDGLTPLHLAAQVNDCEALSLLLERGARVESRAQSDIIPLHVAAESGNWVAFDLLISAGADINAWDRSGDTLLHRQAYGPSSIAVAFKLLTHGPHVEARNSKGYTALQCAAIAGNAPVFFLLVERGANIGVVTPKGETLLHITHPCNESYLNILKFLLNQGLSVEAKSSQGWNPLQQTSFQGTGSPDIVLDRSRDYMELLLLHGADINAVSDSAGKESALHLATRASLPRPSYISLLLSNGAQVNAKTAEGKTALHLAAERGRESIFRILLDHGADSSIKALCSSLEVSSSSMYSTGKSNGVTAFDLAKKNPLGALWFDDEGNLHPPRLMSRRTSVATTIFDGQSDDDNDNDDDDSGTQTGDSTLVGSELRSSVCSK